MTDLIEKVANAIMDAEGDIRDEARAAIAALLKDQMAWNIRVGWADRPILDYARENGIDLND